MNETTSHRYLVDSSRTLDSCRSAIDDIDARLVYLLDERFSLVDRIAAIKRMTGTALRNPDREREVLGRSEKASHQAQIRQVLVRVIEESCKLQESR